MRPIKILGVKVGYHRCTLNEISTKCVFHMWLTHPVANNEWKLVSAICVNVEKEEALRQSCITIKWRVLVSWKISVGLGHTLSCTPLIWLSTQFYRKRNWVNLSFTSYFFIESCIYVTAQLHSKLENIFSLWSSLKRRKSFEFTAILKIKKDFDFFVQIYLQISIAYFFYVSENRIQIIAKKLQVNFKLSMQCLNVLLMCTWILGNILISFHNDET